MNLLDVADEQTRALAGLRFTDPVTHVYNPLEYARAAYDQYTKRYGSSTKEVVFVGMNPGPFGMAQTGVPFGDVSMVRDWLGITADVQKPEVEHPKRPVVGFGCTRSEVSGTRVWGWARDVFHKPEAFFERFYVGNYCPLVFMEQSGRNRTPDKLSRDERAKLYEICDLALARVVEILKPRLVVGVGAFAAERARTALADKSVIVGNVLHPSPANPQANRGWAKQVSEQLRALGVRL